MQKLLKNISFILLFFLIFVGIAILAQSKNATIEDITLNTVVQEINEEKVKELTVDGNELLITLHEDNKKQRTHKEREAGLSETLTNLGVDKDKLSHVAITIKTPSKGARAAANILPIVLPVLLIGGLIWFMMGKAMRGNNQALSFGMSRARMIDPNDKKKRTTFKDVAGNKEAKEELMEIVDFLKAPKKFLKLGAKIPKGALLLGRPGTGKTLMAKAIAGEAGVPFFTISGSEFVEMFVGVGASRVRDLFKKAKKHAPSIVFIDEIDAVGRQRGAGMGGGNDEREQTLNQILVEMDGFETDTNVIVIAATNRPDVLDQALLRPGRFDRRVTVDLPDITDREAILKIHAKEKPLADNVKLHRIAQRTPGFSGADLMNLLNEAALLAGRRNHKKIMMDDIAEAIEKVMIGPARKNKRLDKNETSIVAYHEAGHALVGASLHHADPVQKVSIISRGGAGGYTLAVPKKDQTLKSRAQFIDELAMLLGGYAAEELVFKEPTTGPSNDIERATALARQFVVRYGMSELGVRTFGKNEDNPFLGRSLAETRDYSDKTAEEIDRVVSNLVENARATAKRILIEKRDVLDIIAQTLLKQETIEKDQFDAIIAKKEWVEPEKSDEEEPERQAPSKEKSSSQKEHAIPIKKSDTPHDDTEKPSTKSQKKSPKA